MATKTDGSAAESATDHLDTTDAENKRIVRALSNLWHVEERDEPGAYLVHSESGNTYRVNLLDMDCKCADTAFMCKHLFRVVAETGRTPLDAGDRTANVTLTDAEYAEVAGAVQVLDNGEAIRAAFEATDSEYAGELPDDDRAEVIDAVDQRLTMSGKFGPDDPDAARAAKDKLREGGQAD
jgi:hypothetical protein